MSQTKVEVTRKYYYAGATRIAFREGSGTTATDLKYLLSDHLGSTTTTVNADGSKLAEQGYTPWGALRYGSNTTPTTFGFTGQRTEEELGLSYYGARWYDPYLNRMLQPDSIVPDPYNSLDWDRYSYVRNNPINYTDPSGHAVACLEGDSCRQMARTPVLFKTSTLDGTYLSSDEINMIGMEVWDAAHKDAAYYRYINWLKAREGEEYDSTASAADVFLALHGGVVTFRHTSSTCAGCTAITNDKSTITVYTLLQDNGETNHNYFLTHPEVVIHELGHAVDMIDNVFGNTGLAGYKTANGSHPFVKDGLLTRDGLRGRLNNGQYGGDNSDEEVFADMYVGWVTGFGDGPIGPLRADFMNQYMSNLYLQIFGK